MLQFLQQEGHIGFAPWSPLLEKDELEVVRRYIVYIANPQEEIVEQYNLMYGKIQKPTKKLII